MITQSEFLKDGKTRRCQMRHRKAYRRASSKSNIYGRQCIRPATHEVEGEACCAICLERIMKSARRHGDEVVAKKI